ncbi:beta-glucosidase [bacterium]|nr:MAG: beta-glucosidase [bacterium]
MKFSRSYNYFPAILFAFFLIQSCSKPSYLHSSLSPEKRTKLLLQEMTLEEKIGQMCMYVGEAELNKNNEDEKLNYEMGLGERAELIKSGKTGLFIKVPTFKEVNILQKLAEQSRLKIPLLITTDAIHGHGMYMGNTTNYPTPIGLAASFDPQIAEKIAHFTALEMRVTGYHWTYSPTVDIVRDVRWGRTGETFGEDTYLSTVLGNAMLKGYQGDGLDKPDQVIATAKHFIAGGIAENGLNGAPADISERTLREVFFPPFKTLIDNGVYSVMAAHNEINGVPSHAQKAYLTDLLKKTWGFKGIVISDWMDIERLASVHKVAKNEKEAAFLAVMAGIDVHMQGPGFFDHIKELVNEGRIPMSRIDEAVRAIVYIKFKMGLFEHRYVDEATVNTTLQKAEHLALALEAAQKSMVLLKNKNQLLPLKTHIRSLFITGPNADNQALLGDWSRTQPDEHVTTVLEGIKQSVSNQTQLVYEAVNDYKNYDSALLKSVQKKASHADVSILVLGENSLRFDSHRTSGENLDRSTLELAGDQLNLAKAVKASGKPLIVVLINGGPIGSEWLAENADAILEAWEPGMLGGKAIADVLFGAYNPGGKMPVSVPRSAGHLYSYYNHKPSSFHRGRFYGSTSSPLWPFGFGLSYTRFDYQFVQHPQTAKLTDDVSFSVKVTNSGEKDGDETVLVYLTDEISSVTSPVKKLVAFKRIHIRAGESQTIDFSLQNEQFQLLDSNLKPVVEPGEFTISLGDSDKKFSLFLE